MTPTLVAAPTETPVACDVRCTVEATLREAGMGQWWDNGVADCIITHESGWRVDAISPTHDYGIWQINQVNLWRFHGADWRDPRANTLVAIELYRAAGGWSPWSVHWRCGV